MARPKSKPVEEKDIPTADINDEVDYKASYDELTVLYKEQTEKYDKLLEHSNKQAKVIAILSRALYVLKQRTESGWTVIPGVLRELISNSISSLETIFPPKKG